MAKAAIAPDSLQQGSESPLTVSGTDAAALLALPSQGGKRP